MRMQDSAQINKCIAVTVPAQTPIPGKDVIIDGMSKRNIFPFLDLMDGFYQIYMRKRDIPYEAMSTPGILREIVKKEGRFKVLDVRFQLELFGTGHHVKFCHKKFESTPTSRAALASLQH